MNMSLVSKARQRLQSILRQTQTTSRESVQLARACWVATDYKTALLEQAQQQENQTAIRLLLWEREYGLLRYHGLKPYIRQTALWNRLRGQLPSILSLPSVGSSESVSTTSFEPDKNSALSPSVGSSEKESEQSSNLNDESDNKNVAKVAFMVTGRMKSELLSETFGYDASQVRSMTPVEASLVLQHGVLPKDYGDRIPVLLREYEKAVALQAEEQQALREEEEEQQALRGEEENERPPLYGSRSSEQANGDMMRALPSEGTDTPQQTMEKGPSSFQLSLPPATSTSASQDDNQTTSATGSNETKVSPDTYSTQHSDDKTTKGTLWYELVQTCRGEENVVGLYRTQEEASFGLGVHKELAEGRAKRGDKDAESWTFDIRTTLR